MDTLKGIIERITFTNQQNGYTVALLSSDNGDITIVGTLPYICEGDIVELAGEYIYHSVYGEQFKVEVCEKRAPEGKAAILNYLSSGAIKGVGPTTARNIVDRFGDKALEIIANEPEKLSLIKGISVSKALNIGQEYAKQFNIRDIMLYLSKYKITPEEALKIYKVLGDNTISSIENNPYILCDDEINMSFPRVEEVSCYFPAAKDSEFRTAAALKFILKHNLTNGHSCLPIDKLCAITSDLIDVSAEDCEFTCNTMIKSLKLRSTIINDKTFVFLNDYYASEEYCAARIGVLLKNPPKEEIAADIEIELIEKEKNISYDELQKEAIKLSIKSGIMILTGGPGTGKTTTLNAIIEILSNKDLSVNLCAPTGRAAKRMSELTGREAKTIHRLLEVEWGQDDKPNFQRNERNPLDCDVLIVDELSMVDIKLFESLLKACRLGCRIILVGDSDQLPSIGAGNVLYDLLESELVPSIRLNRVFRQALESLIIKNAHDIISGNKPTLDNKTSDFFMLNEHSPEAASFLIKSLVAERLPKAYGLSPINDIQVLCPSKMMDLGSFSLNNILQDELNPPLKKKKEIHFKNWSLREGDKVMQIKNNYDIMWFADNGEAGSGVFNGDIGILETIDNKNGLFYVRYDDKVATYAKEQINELELSYAVTIHKSQGSEFDCVIIPVLDAPKKLLYRNLLYTAVTRAKKLLILVGSQEVVYTMINNNKKTLRYTALKEFLRRLYD